MIEEFDKEMDALLRQTAQGETVVATGNPKSPHLDADEISAFAENALPEKAKMRLTAHFADCDRCRKILSNTILINAESASETAAAPQTEKTAAVLPWFRRLFAAPMVASALGALVFVFAGLFVFSFLQGTKDSSVAEVFQSREVPINMQGASGEGETRTVESSAAESNAAPSNSASMMSDASTATAGSAMTNSAATNSPVPNRSAGSVSNNSTISNSATVADKPADVKIETVKNLSPLEVKPEVVRQDKDDIQASAAGVSQPKKETENNATVMRLQKNDSALANSPPAPKPAPPVMKSRSADDSKLNSARKMDSETSETRQIGGKTFRRTGGVWYDTSYNSQSTTNIARGSNDFQKLDSGLRSIANALSGTIVVVYNGKAYRIQ